MNLQRNELNLLIQYYSFLANKYDNFNQYFPMPDKYTKSIIKTNLFHLIDIRKTLIEQNFDLSEQLYSQITLFGDQKNHVNEIINYYKSHQEISYDPSFGLDSFEVSASNNLEADIVKNFDFFKDNFDKKISTIQENITNLSTDNQTNIKQLLVNHSEYISSLVTSSLSDKPSIDYSEFDRIIKANMFEKISDDMFKSFDNKINTASDTLLNEINKLQITLSHTAESYKLHEQMSKSIFDNTTRNIMKAQDKMYSDLHNIIAKANISELKSFHTEISSQVSSIREYSKKQNDKLIKVNMFWIIFSLVLLLTTAVSTSYILSNRTVNLLLNLSHKSK